MIEDLYYSKYLKYKNKYIQLKSLIGGTDEEYKYGLHDYKFDKWLPEISKQLNDVKMNYEIFRTGRKPDRSGIYRLEVIITEHINDFYKSLLLLEKLIDQWLDDHVLLKFTDQVEWMKMPKNKGKSLISLIEEQLVKYSIGYKMGEFDVIRQIYILMCTHTPTKKEYEEEYEDDKRYKDIRELAVRIYRKIHPELVEQAMKEDEQKNKPSPENAVYRIGNDSSCKVHHIVK